MPYNTISSDTAGGLGGTCVLRGCVPKKLLVYGSEMSKSFVDAKGYGWDVPDALPEHRWEALMEAKRNELARLNGVYGRILGNANVEHIEGRGRLLDAHTVEVRAGAARGGRGPPPARRLPPTGKNPPG